ncbi:MAG: hypothetical protein ABI594_08070 [Ginsengibacter sp.]
MYRKRIPFFPKIIYYLQYLLFNSSVPPSVKIGKKSKFAYGGIAVVLHGKCEIGENCTIGQGVTVGGRSKNVILPKIGNNVYLSAGSKILGAIIIGDNSIIGPNSVVINDVPNNSIVVGIPGKVIKMNIKPEDFI